jgi:hypothetical protein
MYSCLNSPKNFTLNYLFRNPQVKVTVELNIQLFFVLREVHKRRYLLQPMALEVFSGDGRNYLLAFPRKVRNKVYQRFMAFATAIADSAQQSVAGQKRTANVEQGAGLLSSLIGTLKFGFVYCVVEKKWIA